MMQSLLDWVEKRIPAMNAYKKHLSEYPMPKNSISGICSAHWR